MNDEDELLADVEAWIVTIVGCADDLLAVAVDVISCLVMIVDKLVGDECGRVAVDELMGDEC